MMRSLLLLLAAAVFSVLTDPLSNYFEGTDGLNECKPRLDRRITGYSGILYSHSKYGQQSYNTSRNCVILLLAPIGYRLRITALELEVPTESPRKCEKDSLHLFDHESSLSPDDTRPAHYGEFFSPGPIIGQYCGTLNNRPLNSSSHNAMTLWWHTDANNQGPSAKGFKLHWSTFRRTSGECSENEFSCGDGECIPKALACDRYADCSNAEDLKHSRKIEAHCQNVELDIITSISGVFVLLFTALLIFGICAFTALACFIYKCIKMKHTNKEYQENGIVKPMPQPPQFYPPAPPKMSHPYTPSKTLKTTQALRPVNCNVTIETGDYSYVGNETHRNLL